MVFVIFGDVCIDDIFGKFGECFGDWFEGGKDVFWLLLEFKYVLELGIYVVQKDILQGCVWIGYFGKKCVFWDNDDDFVLQLMNEIFGGGGFILCIIKCVCLDEGLVYSVGLMFQVGQYDSGMFIVIYQLKSEMVVFVVDIVFEEFECICIELVIVEEFEMVKVLFIDMFLSCFDLKVLMMFFFV